MIGGPAVTTGDAARRHFSRLHVTHGLPCP